MQFMLLSYYTNDMDLLAYLLKRSRGLSQLSGGTLFESRLKASAPTEAISCFVPSLRVSKGMS
jgi:hypothetical protein